MDFDRVYSSDMKKMVRWFGILKANAIELKLSNEEAAAEVADENEADAVTVAAVSEPEKPKKKAAKRRMLNKSHTKPACRIADVARKSATQRMLK